jgi:hypothetical protein
MKAVVAVVVIKDQRAMLAGRAQIGLRFMTVSGWFV